MSLIDRAERLKKELTDKWVVVSSTAPELKRFSSLTGKVRTVNMNCRALVEFDNGIDISWYDIDPGFLTVVDGPRPKKTESHGQAKTAAKAAPAANPTTATAPAAAGSPLDKIRAAGAKPAAAGRQCRSSDRCPTCCSRRNTSGRGTKTRSHPQTGSTNDRFSARSDSGYGSCEKRLGC